MSQDQLISHSQRLADDLKRCQKELKTQLSITSDYIKFHKTYSVFVKEWDERLQNHEKYCLYELRSLKSQVKSLNKGLKMLETENKLLSKTIEEMKKENKELSLILSKMKSGIIRHVSNQVKTVEIDMKSIRKALEKQTLLCAHRSKEREFFEAQMVSQSTKPVGFMDKTIQKLKTAAESAKVKIKQKKSG